MRRSNPESNFYSIAPITIEKEQISKMKCSKHCIIVIYRGEIFKQNGSLSRLRFLLESLLQNYKTFVCILTKEKPEASRSSEFYRAFKEKSDMEMIFIYGGNYLSLLFNFYGYLFKKFTKLLSAKEIKGILLYGNLPLLSLPFLRMRSGAGVPIVYNKDGTEAEEARLVDKRLVLSYLKFLLRKGIQKILLPRVDRLIVVSDALARYCQQEFGVLGSKILIIPCVVNTDRFKYKEEWRIEIRQAMGLGDHFVVIYVGGSQPWQCIDEMIHLFKVIKEIRNDAIFFVVTPNKKDFESKLGVRLSHNNYLIKSVSCRDMPKYLSAGDIGLLIREPNLVNCVATPTKFGEYLACGLPVITTTNACDFSELVDRHKLGITLEFEDSEGWQESLVSSGIFGQNEREYEQLRTKCQKMAEQYLSEALFKTQSQSLFTTDDVWESDG